MGMGVSSDECHHFRGVYAHNRPTQPSGNENWVGLWEEEWWNTLQTTSYDEYTGHDTGRNRGQRDR